MRGRVMAILVATALEALGCASGPKPKQPDESRRTPVNADVPAELPQGRAAKKPTEVEWR